MARKVYYDMDDTANDINLVLHDLIASLDEDNIDKVIGIEKEEINNGTEIEVKFHLVAKEVSGGGAEIEANENEIVVGDGEGGVKHSETFLIESILGSSYPQITKKTLEYNTTKFEIKNNSDTIDTILNIDNHTYTYHSTNKNGEIETLFYTTPSTLNYKGEFSNIKTTANINPLVAKFEGTSSDQDFYLNSTGNSAHIVQGHNGENYLYDFRLNSVEFIFQNSASNLLRLNGGSFLAVSNFTNFCIKDNISYHCLKVADNSKIRMDKYAQFDMTGTSRCKIHGDAWIDIGNATEYYSGMRSIDSGTKLDNATSQVDAPAILIRKGAKIILQNGDSSYGGNHFLERVYMNTNDTSWCGGNIHFGPKIVMQQCPYFYMSGGTGIYLKDSAGIRMEHYAILNMKESAAINMQDASMLRMTAGDSQSPGTGTDYAPYLNMMGPCNLLMQVDDSDAKMALGGPLILGEQNHFCFNGLGYAGTRGINGNGPRVGNVNLQNMKSYTAVAQEIRTDFLEKRVYYHRSSRSAVPYISIQNCVTIDMCGGDGGNTTVNDVNVNSKTTLVRIGEAKKDTALFIMGSYTKFANEAYTVIDGGFLNVTGNVHREFHDNTWISCRGILKDGILPYEDGIILEEVDGDIVYNFDSARCVNVRDKQSPVIQLYDNPSIYIRGKWRLNLNEEHYILEKVMTTRNKNYNICRQCINNEIDADYIKDNFDLSLQGIKPNSKYSTLAIETVNESDLVYEDLNLEKGMLKQEYLLSRLNSYAASNGYTGSYLFSPKLANISHEIFSQRAWASYMDSETNITMSDYSDRGDLRILKNDNNESVTIKLNNYLGLEEDEAISYYCKVAYVLKSTPEEELDYVIDQFIKKSLISEFASDRKSINPWNMAMVFEIKKCQYSFNASKKAYIIFYTTVSKKKIEAVDTLRAPVTIPEYDNTNEDSINLYNDLLQTTYTDSRINFSMSLVETYDLSETPMNHGWTPHPEKIENQPLIEIIEDSEVNLRGSSALKLQDYQITTENDVITFTKKATEVGNVDTSVSFTMEELQALKDLLS